MREIQGDIWDSAGFADCTIIPTNGSINMGGEAVMGRGVALQAKIRYPGIQYNLAHQLKSRGNVPSLLWRVPTIYSFPVKHKWMEKADMSLIRQSAYLLSVMLEDVMTIALPRVGCGNGRLLWEDVKPVLQEYLDDRFVVVYKGVD